MRVRVGVLLTATPPCTYTAQVKIQETAELEKKRAERREKMTGVVQLKDERQRPVLWL